MVAILAGVAIGVAYRLSPTTVVFCFVIGLLLAWAQHGLVGRERRWVLALLGLSVALRLAVLVGFFAFGRSRDALPFLIGDEWLIKWRSILILNQHLGRGLAPTDLYNLYESYGRTSVMNMFATWQFWFGPAPYGVHLVNMTLWFAAAIMLFRVARSAFGAMAALGGLAALLCVPTLFVWSISALKEPAYFFLTALAIVGGTLVVRGPKLRVRAGGVVCIVIALLLVEPIRAIALVVAGGGIAVGAVGWLTTRRAWFCLSVAVLALVAAMRLQYNPSVQAEALKFYRLAATNHLGNVQTVGVSYQLLDQRFYMAWEADPIRTMQPEEAGRFTVRALASFVTHPIPWAAASPVMVAFIAEQMVWYLLAVLACVGAAAGWRRDPVFTWMLVGNILVGAAVVALFNGNVGTFVRFRDSVVTIIVWLSALGGCAAVEWVARRSSGESIDAAN